MQQTQILMQSDKESKQSQNTGWRRALGAAVTVFIIVGLLVTSFVIMADNNNHQYDDHNHDDHSH
tara:strand:- start:20616 stop:20810 length:195 start_codon:yes stop_codon:yes gene_type:complete